MYATVDHIAKIRADQEKNRVTGMPAKPAKLMSAREAAQATIDKALEEIGGMVNNSVNLKGPNKVHMPHRITQSVSMLKSVITELEKLGYRVVANDGHVKGFDITWDLATQAEDEETQVEEEVMSVKY
jgi:hypothetical protein